MPLEDEDRLIQGGRVEFGRKIKLVSRAQFPCFLDCRRSVPDAHRAVLTSRGKYSARRMPCARKRIRAVIDIGTQCSVADLEQENVPAGGRAADGQPLSVLAELKHPAFRHGYPREGVPCQREANLAGLLVDQVDSAFQSIHIVRVGESLSV